MLKEEYKRDPRFNGTDVHPDNVCEEVAEGIQEKILNQFAGLNVAKNGENNGQHIYAFDDQNVGTELDYMFMRTDTASGKLHRNEHIASIKSAVRKEKLWNS